MAGSEDVDLWRTAKVDGVTNYTGLQRFCGIGYIR
jgi:hypothetical protein